MPYVHIDWGTPFTEWFEEKEGRHDLSSQWIIQVASKFLQERKDIGFLLGRITTIDGVLEKVEYQPTIPTLIELYSRNKKNKLPLKQWLLFLIQTLSTKRGFN
jgi:hypothetical protein